MKKVLVYNFTEERLKALKIICMMMKAACRAVGREEMLQPAWFLAGIKGVQPVSGSYSGDEGKDECLLLCGFERGEFDMFFMAVKKSPLKKVDLKAILTSSNVNWSGAGLIL
ncbi:MAG: DUF3783 domain-containing protein [Phascolarctobacterium sp.]|nr:DUF3783 domain-containing protein [Phascolarctobacterium sp.]